MSRGCEVCEGMGLETVHERPRFVRIEERIFALCDAHAAACEDLGTVEEVRDRFKEVIGNRSYVGRRAPVSRRVFPPRPEGRRNSGGRRGDDADDAE